VKAGTLIRLKDGRSGRVVYNGLDGVGIKFGADPVDVDAEAAMNSQENV
jgi:hypothetical protein